MARSRRRLPQAHPESGQHVAHERQQYADENARDLPAGNEQRQGEEQNPDEEAQHEVLADPQVDMRPVEVEGGAFGPGAGAEEPTERGYRRGRAAEQGAGVAPRRRLRRLERPQAGVGAPAAAQRVEAEDDAAEGEEHEDGGQ